MQENSQNTDLLEGLKSGDEKAFADIYHKYSAAILANILKLNIRRPEAEDILQDVFVEL
jgi:RNA polymerase sigma-70 factor (ECF subfamily)